MEALDTRDFSRRKLYSHSFSEIAMNAEGTLVVSGGHDGLVNIWNNGKVIVCEKGHCKSVSCLTLSPKQDIVVSGSYREGHLKIWKVKTGKLHGRYSFNDENVDGALSALFSPGGKFLAVAIGDACIHIVDVTSEPYARLARVWYPSTAFVRSLAFSPDDVYLAASADSAEVRVWTLSDLSRENPREPPLLMKLPPSEEDGYQDGEVSPAMAFI